MGSAKKSSKASLAAAKRAKARKAELADAKKRLAAVKAKVAKKARKKPRKAVGGLKVDTAGKVRDSRGVFVKPPRSKVDGATVADAGESAFGTPGLFQEWTPDTKVAWTVTYEFEPLAPRDAAKKLEELFSLPEVVFGFVASEELCMVLVFVIDDEGNVLGWHCASSAVNGRVAAAQAVYFVESAMSKKVGNYSLNPTVTAVELRKYKTGATVGRVVEESP